MNSRLFDADALALSARQFWALFAVLFASASAPVVLTWMPPLFDYPNHLARIHVLLHEAGSPLLQRYYQVAWRPLPNLAMDLVISGLGHLMPLAIAGRVFILLTFLLLAGGTAALHRVLSGRWSAWPLLAFLFLYSRSFLWGFLNYLFGAGLALFALAAFVSLSGKRPFAALVVSSGFALALFFAHMMAFVIYGLLVAGYLLGEIWRDGTPNWRAITRRLGLAGIAFLPPLMILAESGEGAALGSISWGRYVRKRDLPFSVFDNYDRIFDIACFALLIGALAVAFGKKWLTVIPPLRVPLLLLGLTYLVAPTNLMTAWGVDHRMPLVMALVLVAGLIAPDTTRRRAASLMLGALVLFAIRMAVIGLTWQHSQKVYDRLIAILDQLPQGAKLAVALAPHASVSTSSPLMHVPTLAIIDRNAFVPTLFAQPTQQPVLLAPDYRLLADQTPPDELWRILVEGREDDEVARRRLGEYDAVVILAPHPFTAPTVSFLQPIAVEPNFALYRILH